LLALVLGAPVGYACGDSANSAPPGNATDGGPVGETGAIADAGGDAGPKAACNLAAPFGTPVRVPGVNTPTIDWCPRLSANEHELYLTREVPDAAFELLSFSRSSTDAPFGNEHVLAALSSPEYDECAFISADGKTLFFDSRRTGNYDLYVATRNTVDTEFGQVTPLVGVNTNEAEWWQWPVGDELFYTAKRGTDVSIFRATRVAAMSYTTGAVVSELDAPGLGENGPSLTGDGLRIYFGRYGSAAGDRGIFTATRPSLNAAFETPTRVPELDGPGGEDDVGWISPDGCTLYFASDRDSDGGRETDIYRATKPPL